MHGREERREEKRRVESGEWSGAKTAESRAKRKKRQEFRGGGKLSRERRGRRVTLEISGFEGRTKRRNVHHQVYSVQSDGFFSGGLITIRNPLNPRFGWQP